VIEGGGRKWVIPNASPDQQAIFYFAKDVFLGLAAVVALRTPPRSAALRRWRSGLLFALLVFILAVLLTLANIAPVGAVVSTRCMIALPLLAVALSGGLRSQRDIDLIINTVGVLALGSAALGVLQFSLPASHILNQQVSSKDMAILDAAGLRASGPFAFITGMADLTILATWAGVYLVLQKPRHPWGYATLAGGVLCSLTAMSRTGLLGAVLVGGFSLLSVRHLGRFLPVLVLVALGGVFLFRDRSPTHANELGVTQAIFERHQHSGENSTERIMNTLLGVPLACAAFPAGNGLGTAQNGQIVLDTGAGDIVFHEYDLARVTFEVGIVGLIAVVVARLSTLIGLWRALAGGPHLPAGWRDLRRVTFAALSVWFLGNTCFNHVGCTFAWVIAAVAFSTVERESRLPSVAPPRSRPRTQALVRVAS
jgi:hypothetical protein